MSHYDKDRDTDDGVPLKHREPPTTSCENTYLRARVAELEAQVASRDRDIVGYVRTIEDTSKQQDEAEADVKKLLGIVDSCHKRIAELETKRCDCGMKS